MTKNFFFFLPKQTFGSLMSLFLFFVCVKANEGLHCFTGPWGVLWGSKETSFCLRRHLLSYQLLCCSGWPAGFLGGQLVAQGENQAVLTGHWKQYHVLGGTSLGLLLSWSSWAALWEQDAGKLSWLSEELLSPAALGRSGSHRKATCVERRAAADCIEKFEPCLPLPITMSFSSPFLRVPSVHLIPAAFKSCSICWRMSHSTCCYLE